MTYLHVFKDLSKDYEAVREAFGHIVDRGTITTLNAAADFLVQNKVHFRELDEGHPFFCDDLISRVKERKIVTPNIIDAVIESLVGCPTCPVYAQQYLIYCGEGVKPHLNLAIEKNPDINIQIAATNILTKMRMPEYITPLEKIAQETIEAASGEAAKRIR